MTTPRISRAGVMAAMWLAGGAALHACPVCFQLDDPSAAAGVQAAVFVLAGVTVAVLVPCAAFALRLARRDAAGPPADAEESRR